MYPIIYLSTIFVLLIQIFVSCVMSSNDLKYLWGDAFENPDAVSPDGSKYPWEEVHKVIGSGNRGSRSFYENTHSKRELLSPAETRRLLLRSLNNFDNFEKEFGQGQFSSSTRTKRADGVNDLNNSSSSIMEEIKKEGGCVPPRMCQSTYNTTAPLFGISLTSGKPVTIVQKFPDLLQQVVFQVCSSTECEVIHGECVQTYLPYLFLVIPLGPVTLTGQDYVLVESGCVCQPKYAQKYLPPPLPFIQPINK